MASTQSSAHPEWFDADREGERRPRGASLEIAEVPARTESFEKAQYMQSKLKYHRSLVKASTSRSFVVEQSFLHLANPPLHVLPRQYFVRLPFGLDNVDSQGRQGSLGFIFTLVTTMMGSTVLSLPWGFQQAGLLASLCVILFFGFVAYFSCSIILDCGKEVDDFSEVCAIYLGDWSMHLANFTSIFILWGAAMCMHVLLANNIQSIVLSVASRAMGNESNLFFCCGTENFQYAVAGVAIAAILLPILFVADISKLASMASYGFISLLYNAAFLVVSSTVDLIQIAEIPSEKRGQVLLFGDMSPVGAFVGMMGMSLFVHSVLLPIANNHVHAKTSPPLVKRDLGIAYAIAIAIYILVGAAPAVAYQLGRYALPNYASLRETGLPQNMLLAYGDFSIGALIGQIFITLQIAVVYPILAAVARKQLFAAAFGTEPGGSGAAVFNVCFVGVCTLVTTVYPYPGSVVGYVGAYTAIVYMLWLPILVNLTSLRKKNQLTSWTLVSNLFLAVLGTVIVLLQFVGF